MHFNPGLEGVIIGTTEISYIDGKEGRLLYRGYNIHDLVHASFEETVYLLWFGELPTMAQHRAFRLSLSAERALPRPVIDIMRQLPPANRPMDTLRTLASMLAHFDEEVNDRSDEARRRKAVRITARMATLVAAWRRVRDGKDPIDPDPDLSHAANFLYMLSGERPDDVETRAFDELLILHAEHEMNASTFTARVIASTLAGMYSAIAGAIGALGGPLQGGASLAVMDMLLDIGAQARAEEWVRSRLQERKRIMGFGHRIYKTEDPRASHLRDAALVLSRRAGDTSLYDITRTIEDIMGKERGLYANIDLYSASCYHLLGIPSDMYTPVFAAGRIAGWTAHIFEQWENNRLIRPEGEYVGPMRRAFAPLEERK